MTPENHNDNDLVKPDRTWPRWTVISGAAAALAAGAVGFSMLGGSVRADLPDSIRLADRVTVTEASNLGFPVELAPDHIVPMASSDSPFDSADSFHSAGAPPAEGQPLPQYDSSFDSSYDSPYVVPAPVYSYDSVSADSLDSIDSPESIQSFSADSIDSISFDSVDSSS